MHKQHVEFLDYNPINGTVINITSTNQDQMLCLNISDYIIDDGIAEDIEDFNLSLSVVQTSFSVEQLIFYQPTTQVFIEDDDTTGKIVLGISSKSTLVCSNTRIPVKFQPAKKLNIAGITIFVAI